MRNTRKKTVFVPVFGFRFSSFKMANTNKNLKAYGLCTTSSGRYNLYASDKHVELADQSESNLVRTYIADIRSRLIPIEEPDEDDEGAESGEIIVKPISESDLVEDTIEKIILNAEERANRTIETLMDPNHFRSHMNPADNCHDRDRVSMTRLNFTNSYNLQVGNSLAISE